MVARRNFRKRVRAEEALRRKGRVVSVKDLAKTKPTAANKAAAQLTNQAYITGNRITKGQIGRAVYDSSKTPTWGTAKPPVVGRGGKKFSAQVGHTRASNKPTIKSTARLGSKSVVGNPYANQVTGALKRTQANVMRSHLRGSTEMRMHNYQKALAKTARATKAFNTLGLGLMAAEAIYKGVKRATGPGGKAFHGQFVDYTSKPTNRGKRGVNY